MARIYIDNSSSGDVEVWSLLISLSSDSLSDPISIVPEMTRQSSWTNTFYTAVKTSKSSVPCGGNERSNKTSGENVVHNRVPDSEE